MVVEKKKTYVAEVGPSKPASGGSAACGPVYKALVGKEETPHLAECKTLYEMFMRSVDKYGERNCLGKRDSSTSEYSWITYKETEEMVAAVGSALADVGLEPHGRVGVYGANCPEWMIAMQACNRMNLYCVPLYDTLGENAIEFIVKHSETSIVFCQSSKFGTIAKTLPDLKALVKTVVYWGEENKEASEAAKTSGVAVYSFDEFIALGKSKPQDARPPAAEDLCTIMYTSGTTGDPKGVELTHKNVMAAVASLVKFVGSLGNELDENDVFFSFLPLAHIFDRAGEEMFLYIGGSIGYWRGDIKGLVDDIGALKPTLFCGVPRVYDRIYSGVMDKLEHGSILKKFLFNWGFNRKLHALDSGVPFEKAAPFFDKLVFSKIKERLGGRVKLLVSGGAPLARHVEDFLRVTMCCRVLQGYGLTETCAGTCICVPDVPSQVGTVGPPLPYVSLRLEAVPEMNYDPMAQPPRGELCIKGDTVFAGYYKDKKKTDEVLESDGWFHSGDIAEMTPEGAFKIIDRKKNIFKLSQGEYVAVEKVESAYKKDQFVEQIWVYGNSFENCLVAVVVPAETKLREWAQHHHASHGTMEEMCKDEKLKKHILETLTATAKELKLKGFEIVKDIHLETEPFSVENDLITPTFKLKRPQLQKKYQSEIDAMYQKMKSK